MFGPFGVLMFSSVNFGSPRSSTACATIAAASADGPNSHSSFTRCVETAMLGISSSAPSSAPDTVPEYVTSSPRFQPLLMPDTIRSGFPFSTCVIARFTQSVGVPSTAKTFGRDGVDPQRPPQRQRMADGAGFLNRRDDGHVAERRERVGQRTDSLRVHAIIIGHENSGHGNHRS